VGDVTTPRARRACQTALLNGAQTTRRVARTQTGRQDCAAAVTEQPDNLSLTVAARMGVAMHQSEPRPSEAVKELPASERGC
jgi:hypothetical protein